MLLSLMLLLISSSCFYESRAADPSPCGDWEPFQQDLCYKIFDKSTLYSYEAAEKLCQQNGSTLLNIQSKEEQEYLFNYIFTVNKVVDNLWIGAKYSTGDKAYKWENGAELRFTNWQTGYPKNNAADHCVQLNSEEGQVGKWIDGICEKKALVVCQKQQTWSIDQMQQILRELSATVKQNIVNPIPIGFVYVQLPHEPAPSEIWTWMTWTDVSATYKGLFFRVEGDNAAAFGTVQEGSSPRLTNVQFHSSGTFISDGPGINIAAGTASQQIYVGNEYSGSNGRYSLSFNVSAAEVRPRNTAIKIWKRSA